MEKKKVLILGTALVVLLALCTTLYFVFKPEGTAGAKDIVVEVVYEDETSKSFDISTDHEFLRGALEEIELVEGTESEYGLYILTVDGVTADEAAQQWWCVTKAGEAVTTGVDTTPILDGDTYELTLTTGW